MQNALAFVILAIFGRGCGGAIESPPIGVREANRWGKGKIFAEAKRGQQQNCPLEIFRVMVPKINDILIINILILGT